jgi:hypothetical protein
MDDPRYHLNGIDGESGQPLSPPLTPEEVVELLDPAAEALVTAGERRPTFGVDPEDLASCGWGVLFPRDVSPEVREALEPLLAHRRAEAGTLYREYGGEHGYAPGESTSDLLARLGVGPGPVSPRKAPYYLLLVGGPEEIPFTVQYELDLAFAVGRVSFETAEEYARYADSVLAAERGEVRRPRRVSFVATDHDDATQMSSLGLCRPLAAYLSALELAGGWEIETHLGREASLERFAAVLGGEGTPALAFTASHGVRYPVGDPRQRLGQGAFVCAGPHGAQSGNGTMEYFDAGEVPEGPGPAGLVSFHFACYSAGAPALDDFAHKRPDAPVMSVAPEAMVAALPRRLLGHPKGGALAVVGHVDRAWGWSYVFGHDYHREVFESTLAEVLSGFRIGAAMERFGERHGQLAAMLAAARQRRELGLEVDVEEYADLLTATHDARNYVVLGDPAVRLAVDPG